MAALVIAGFVAFALYNSNNSGNYNTSCSSGQLCITNQWHKIIAVQVDGNDVGQVNTGATNCFTIATGSHNVIMYNPNTLWEISRKQRHSYYQKCETYNLTMQ